MEWRVSASETNLNVTTIPLLNPSWAYIFHTRHRSWRRDSLYCEFRKGYMDGPWMEVT